MLRIWDKLQSDGPLGSNADFSLPPLTTGSIIREARDVRKANKTG